MTTIHDAPRYASPVDYEAYGQYGRDAASSAGRPSSGPGTASRGRITADGSSGYRAEPGRYHLYIAWGCPWAQRTAILRKLMGLEDAVSLSYVDDADWDSPHHREALWIDTAPSRAAAAPSLPPLCPVERRRHAGRWPFLQQIIRFIGFNRLVIYGYLSGDVQVNHALF
jgi:hypothetical protein